jgi:hypothetical protein
MLVLVYYMPEIGRFISQDPIAGFINDPLTLNAYPYVLNNPNKYIDPSGEFGQILAGIVGGAVIGALGTLAVDIVTGDLSSWETYVANTAAGAVGGAILAGTGNIYAASAAASRLGAFAASGASAAVASGGSQALDILTDPEKDFANDFNTERFINNTLIGTTTGIIAGGLAGKIVSRGPGAPPTKFGTALTGQIAQNKLWGSGIVSNTLDNVLKETVDFFWK